MKASPRERIAFWLEAQPWARPFVLREDPSSGEFIDRPVIRMIRVRAVNRLNGHEVIIERQPNTWKGDGYIAAALIGALVGAAALYGLTELFEALR